MGGVFMFSEKEVINIQEYKIRKYHFEEFLQIASQVEDKGCVSIYEVLSIWNNLNEALVKSLPRLLAEVERGEEVFPYSIESLEFWTAVVRLNSRGVSIRSLYLYTEGLIDLSIQSYMIHSAAST